MANVVKTVFVVDATQAFRTADAVERRYKDLDKKTTAPFVASSATSSTTRRGGRDLELSPAILARRKAEAEAAQATAERAARIGSTIGSVIGIGITGAILAAGAAAAAAATAFALSIKAAQEAENRTKALRAALIDLGGSYVDLNAQVNTLATTTKFALNDAVQISIAAAQASSQVKVSTAELISAATDIGSRRNLNADQISDILRDLEKGSVNVALGGKAAAASFDIYAASLGRTADSLTDVERRQVALNEFLRQSNLAAGEAANAANSQEAAINKLKNTVSLFLADIGEKLSPGVIAFLDFLRNPNFDDVGRFSFNATAGLFVDAPVDIKSFVERDKQATEDAKKRFKEYTDLFLENKRIIERALQNPTGDLVSFSLSRFANLDEIRRSGPEVQRRLIAEAVERGKEFGETFKKSTNQAIARGDILELRNFKKSFEEIKNVFSFDDYTQISQSLNKAIDDLVNRGIEKVKELGKQFKETLAGLTSGVERDNPYLSFLLEADKATQQLREQTRGLSNDLKDVFTKMLEQQNQLKLFELRLNSRFEAFDLRETARRFRDTSVEDQIKNDERALAAIDRYANGLAQTRNVNNLRAFFSGTSADTRVGLFDFIRQQETAEGLFRNDELQEQTRRLLGREDEDRSVQGRFQKQLEILEGLRAGTGQERSLVDRKILSLAQQLSPEELSSRQREVVAEAAEREAARVAQQETRANEIRDTQLKTVQRIEGYLKTLTEKAKIEGVAGIEVLVKDETEGGVNSRSAASSRRPSQRDTDRLYEFTGFGIAGGTNF